MREIRCALGQVGGKRYTLRIQPGKRVGSPDRDGYLYITHLKKRYALHRLAWLYVTGAWPVEQIDHWMIFYRLILTIGHRPRDFQFSLPKVARDPVKRIDHG